jgi:hypothetical protein
MSLLRPTAKKYGRILSCLAVCLGMLGFSSASALAASKGHSSSGHYSAKPATAKENAALAVCPGQAFYQPFLAFSDSNYYTLADGSEFDEGAGGWELRNGAEIVDGSRPGGASGDVLDLPSGAYAISPPVCVTLQYPTARAWFQATEGSGSVTVGVYYAGAKSRSATGQAVDQFSGKAGGGWQLSDPFDVRPELTGKEEGVREVRFVYANTTRSSDFQLWGLYVDPRMR